MVNTTINQNQNPLFPSKKAGQIFLSLKYRYLAQPQLRYFFIRFPFVCVPHGVFFLNL